MTMNLHNEVVDPLDILERNVNVLEQKVYGKIKSAAVDMKKNIAELLLDTDSQIKTSLMGRESVSMLMNRMEELNEYLDPNFEDNNLDADSMEQYILTMLPELKETTEQLQKLEKLIPILNSDALKNTSDMSLKLEKLTTVNLDIKEGSDKVSNEIATTMQKYNDIINSVSKTFAEMDIVITELEAAKQKTTVTE